MEIKCGKTHAEMTLQHLEYGSVIAGACLNPYSILKIFEEARAIGTRYQEKICKNAGISHNWTLFVAWQQIEYFPAFYDQTMEAESPNTYVDYVNRKLKIYHCYKPVGNTSQPIEDVIIDPDTNKPLLHASLVAVNVDPVTRRPTPYHQYLKEYYTPEDCVTPVKFGKVLPPKCQKRYEIPSNAVTFVRITSVSARQIDRNKHVNQASYIEFSFDCLGDAFAKSTFDGFDSIFDHKIRRMSLLYLKECVLGDCVDTTVWQDDMNHRVFKFHIKKRSDLLCQVEIEFFPQNEVLKSRL